MHFHNLALAFTGALMATVDAAPTEAVNQINNDPPKVDRGFYGTVDMNGKDDMVTMWPKEHLENVPKGTTMKWFQNVFCGYCIVYKDRDARGGMLWHGPAGPRKEGVAGAESFICFKSQKSGEEFLQIDPSQTIQPREDKVDVASSSEVSTPTGNPADQQPRCGDYYLIEEEAVIPLYSSDHYENVEQAVHMAGLVNLSCGFCIVFRGRDTTGDVLWSGGPDPKGTQQVRGGQSYFCY